MAGNMSQTLTKDVLKAIGSELRRGKRLHDDVILELI